jgi:hypothetical protein
MFAHNISRSSSSSSSSSSSIINATLFGIFFLPFTCYTMLNLRCVTISNMHHWSVDWMIDYYRSSTPLRYVAVYLTNNIW